MTMPAIPVQVKIQSNVQHVLTTLASAVRSAPFGIPTYAGMTDL